MPAWKRSTLGELIDQVGGEIKTGPFGSQLHQSDYVDDPEGVPVVMPKDMMEGRVNYATTARISRAKASELAQHITQRRDVLIPRRGELGRQALIRDTDVGVFCGTGSLRVRLYDSELLPEFLFFYLRSETGRHQLESKATGVTMPNISTSVVRSVEIAFPSRAAQHAIVSILMSYDQLIENNQAQIEILEEMAQTIYREWFVNFRFPGHEMVPMIESELGLLPRGWETTTLSEAAEIVMGQSPKSECYNETGEGLPFHQGVGTFGTRFPVTDRHTTVTNRVAEKDDVLFSVRAPVGRINVAHERLVVGRGLAAIRSNRDNPWFLLQQMKEGFQQEDTMGGGTIFKAVTKADVHGIPYLLPPEAVEDAFDKTVDPISRLIENLVSQNRNLRATRDLLLPRLISGEIDVSELDIDTSWLAA